MSDQIFRKQAMDRLSAPEQLDEYLRVTSPAVWMALAAILLLLAGAFVWSSVTFISSFATGRAEVENGRMTVWFDEGQDASNVEAGMRVTVGDTASVISSVGVSEDGNVFALADTSLRDGVYAARVSYRETQLLKLLFN